MAQFTVESAGLREVRWSLWRLKLPAIKLFIQKFTQSGAFLSQTSINYNASQCHGVVILLKCRGTPIVVTPEGMSSSNRSLYTLNSHTGSDFEILFPPSPLNTSVAEYFYSMPHKMAIHWYISEIKRSWTEVNTKYIEATCPFCIIWHSTSCIDMPSNYRELGTKVRRLPRKALDQHPNIKKEMLSDRACKGPVADIQSNTHDTYCYMPLLSL